MLGDGRAQEVLGGALVRLGLNEHGAVRLVWLSAVAATIGVLGLLIGTSAGSVLGHSRANVGWLPRVSWCSASWQIFPYFQRSWLLAVARGAPRGCETGLEGPASRRS